MTTAQELVFGGARTVTTSSAFTLCADVRAWFINAGAPLTVTLPPARVGSALVYDGGKGVRHTIFAQTSAVTVNNSAGAAVGSSIAAGFSADYVLADDSTTSGTWIKVARNAWAKGSPFPTNRKVFKVYLKQSATEPFVLTDHLRNVRGWNGTDVVVCDLVIAGENTSIVRGSNITNKPAIDTGTLPTDSFVGIYLFNGAIVAGCGGRGGTGSGGILAQNGHNGGRGLIIRCAHWISGSGTIQGGGGGGGGGAASSTCGGGGGGGGAGYLGGRGGAGGTFGGGTATSGADGRVDGGGFRGQVIGGSGAYDGGHGGNPGGNGDPGGSGGTPTTGGLKGFAIAVHSDHDPANINLAGITVIGGEEVL